MPTSLTAVPAYDPTCFRCSHHWRTTVKSHPRQCPQCGTRRWETGKTPPREDPKPQGE